MIPEKLDGPHSAVARFVNLRSVRPNHCLLVVRTVLDIPALFPTAEAALTHADPEPWPPGQMPVGAPIWFHTPSGYGHVALSVGGGYVVSTDMPRKGIVGVVHCEEIEERWGARLVGWSRTLNNRRIPWL